MANKIATFNFGPKLKLKGENCKMNKKNSTNRDPLSQTRKLVSEAVSTMQDLENIVTGKLSSYVGDTVNMSTTCPGDGYYFGDSWYPTYPTIPWNPNPGIPNSIPGIPWSTNPWIITTPPPTTTTSGTIWVDQGFGNYPKVDIIKSKEQVEILNGELTHFKDNSDFYSYKILVYISNINKDEINIELTKGTETLAPSLTINVDAKEDKEINHNGYFQKESKHTKAKRVITLPMDADVECLTDAILKDGILVFYINRFIKPKPQKQNYKVTIK